MRIPVLFLSLALVCPATPLRAQDPGAQQDAEAAREKLLKAEDQLDNIQANSEAAKNAVDGMKTDMASLQATVTKLQSDNAALQQQVADLQTALSAEKAEEAKQRQVLIDNVAAMIAKAPGATKSKKKRETTDESADATPPTSTSSGPVKTADSLAPPPDAAPSTTPATDDNVTPPPAPAPKPQKGYYHIVASGETLKLIVEAYRDNGVKTSITAIRKANGLTPDSVLQPGQKLFIPKPGT